MSDLKKTPYQKHVMKWKDCQKCHLSKKRTKVVLLRGRIPCDVLFIGKAPGASEDVLGQSFIGPAGKLLDQIIKTAVNGKYTSPENRGWDELRFAFTDLVGCIPLDESNKFSDPDQESLKACKPRLKEIAKICKPRLVVLVGKLVQQQIMGQNDLDCDWLPDGVFLNFVSIVHPVLLLETEITQRGLEIQKCTARLSEGFASL